jgi:hypothetical protein
VVDESAAVAVAEVVEHDAASGSETRRHFQHVSSDPHFSALLIKRKARLQVVPRDAALALYWLPLLRERAGVRAGGIVSLPAPRSLAEYVRVSSMPQDFRDVDVKFVGERRRS